MTSILGGVSLAQMHLTSAPARAARLLSTAEQASLRARDVPVIARTRDARTIVDLRSVDPSDDALVTEALRNVDLREQSADYVGRLFTQSPGGEGKGAGSS